MGASLAEPPAGYHHDSDVIRLGLDDDVFQRAARGLREWQAHRAANVSVFPPDAPIERGTTVALALPFVGAHVLAACRIVTVVNEPDRFGFAYGTLRGHPEQGEEAFVVDRVANTIRFRITAFSRPADPLARLGAPVARHIQRRVTLAYLSGLDAFVRALPS